MTDRELLELAAKAAGIGLVGPTDKYIAQHDKGSAAFIIDNDKGGHSNWNPITDDGDALRLAVKLNLQLDFDSLSDGAIVQIRADYHDQFQGCRWNEWLGSDPYAATRRAIVRAAAEIGRSK